MKNNKIIIYNIKAVLLSSYYLFATQKWWNCKRKREEKNTITWIKPKKTEGKWKQR